MSDRQPHRSRVRSFVGSVAIAVAALGSLLLATGCPSEGVGDPCTPESVPVGGFNSQEVYLETSALQCRTRVCMVYHFQGVLEEPVPQEQEQRVYCTCRCRSDQAGATNCACPDGYNCQEVFQTGGAGVRGSYCIKNGT